MSRFIALGTLCLLLGGCAYYPPYGYGYAPGYGYTYPPAYRYGPPPGYGYPAPYPAPYAAQPYSAQPYASHMPQTLGPNGDISGATGSN